MNRIIAAIIVTALLVLSGCSETPPESSEIMEKDGKTTDMNGMNDMNDMTELSDETEGGAEAGVYHKITAAEAYEMMNAQSVIVVDVRTSEEYAAGHIADAVLVPNESIGGEMPDELPDTDAVLLVYCRSGRRSKEASDKLLALGYKYVYDFGGINDWTYDTVAELEEG